MCIHVLQVKQHQNSNIITPRLIANWRYTPIEGQEPPPFMQFDGGENPADKFIQMRKQGALFVDPDTLSNEHWVAKCLDKDQTDKIAPPEQPRKSKANFCIRFFHAIFELLCALIPGLQILTLGYIFPFYAYYLAV